MADNSTKCKLYPDEVAKCEVLKYIKIASSTLSVICALVALLVIVYFRLFKDFTQRMVINLCVASLLLAVSYLMTQYEDDVTALCVVQGAAITFSIWACMLWSMCILANIYTKVVRGYEWKEKEVLATSLCWLVCAVMAAIPFFGKDVYAPTEVWCWIKDDAGWRFGVWYIWHMLSVVVFILATIHIIWVLNKMKSSEQNIRQLDTLKEDIKTLGRYPVVYTLFSIVAIICRIQNIFQGSSFAMLILFGLTVPMLGSAVSVVFVFDKTTLKLFRREEIKKAYQKWTNKKAPVQTYSVNSGFEGSQGDNNQKMGV